MPMYVYGAVIMKTFMPILFSMPFA